MKLAVKMLAMSSMAVLFTTSLALAKTAACGGRDNSPRVKKQSYSSLMPGQNTSAPVKTDKKQKATDGSAQRG